MRLKGVGAQRTFSTWKALAVSLWSSIEPTCFGNLRRKI
jgi:hypothetical protein